MHSGCDEQFRGGIPIAVGELGIDAPGDKVPIKCIQGVPGFGFVPSLNDP